MTARTGALICALGGAALLVGAAMVDPAQAAYSYLTAYSFATGIAVSAIALLLIQTLIAAEWFIAVREPVESMASVVPVCAALFVPIAVGAALLYPWVHPAARLGEHDRALVAAKAAYLNLPFFIVRAAAYLVCWTVIVARIRRRARALGRVPLRSWMRESRPPAAIELIVLAFTLTFAAFDWLMSLRPTWFSTIFGVQIFAGGMVGCLALLAIVLGAGAPAARPAGEAAAERSASVGKLMLTFVCFWAYVTFSQLLIIWIADLPDELTWYAPRLSGSWLALGSIVAIGQFAVPFGLLLSHRWKRRPRHLAWLGVWLLLMHYAETYWIVMPERQPDSAWPHVADLGSMLAVIGFGLAWAYRRRMRGRAEGEPNAVDAIGAAAS